MRRPASLAASVYLLAITLSCTFLKVHEPGPEATRPAARGHDVAETYGELFERVQMAAIYPDSKRFVDMIPRDQPARIMANYAIKKPTTKEELKSFVEREFYPPADPTSDFEHRPGESIGAHIKRLWPFLKREPTEETQAASSLIPIPFSYVVPGGRFREIYYWDSYFTQLGLIVDKEDELFQNMVRNFEHFLLTLGHIPNGNRDYYRFRSQPPFFSYMISLWQTRFGLGASTRFLPALKREYAFWMDGAEGLKVGQAHRRVVALEGGVLNRYWDDKDAPRPEAYKEDRALAARAAVERKRQPKDVYRDLRASAESGWDFSSRWFEGKDFATVRTTALVPVDLNALLVHLEQKIADYAEATGDAAEARLFRERAETRRRLIDRYMWDPTAGTYRDYDFAKGQRTKNVTIAMATPLFAGIASPEQAAKVARVLETQLLRPGGLVTTTVVSGQQWDAPNGWPPHQWMAYAGLRRYGLKPLAEKIRSRWLALNERVFKENGKLLEKYNVQDISLRSGGGEYPTQDGFGWANGVYRALETPEASLKHLGL